MKVVISDKNPSVTVARTQTYNIRTSTPNITARVAQKEKPSIRFDSDENKYLYDLVTTDHLDIIDGGTY